MSRFHINTITLDTFKDVLSRYPATVPEKLRDLDTQRYATIPTQLASREGPEHLTKDEVVKLVEWKLKHGTFRPQLLALVQSNTSDLIERTTREALRLVEKPNTSPLSALKVLVQLKGIGPATASLLLSVARPGEVPFFSDELYRWCTWDEKGGGGWKRGIKYSVKEYAVLVEGVKGGRKRLGEVGAVDFERVAWVLGKEGVDVSAIGVDGEEEEEEEEEQKEEKPKRKTAKKDTSDAETIAKRGTKRKATQVKLRAEGTRKSARTKK
ncbi:hypothetical protein EJ02DRAFT_512828 [Clathrospora elynae]|uniref:Uncharacterized protein n=1 Tax=Clathrospora elynae TaxID=706981 RepID=A0A6A5SME1_9PLEO|nr:hypothetical protein EJ02DRAFT_512828 [Clathrospora elynae]